METDFAAFHRSQQRERIPRPFLISFFDSFDLGVEADNDDNIAGVDFAGNIKFGYFGALLYVKAFF